MSFQPKPILMKTFVESQLEVISVYEFQTKSNSYEDLCWVSVWSYLRLRVSNMIEFFWRHLLSFTLKLCKFMSFKVKRILVNKFVESQFGVMYLYEFPTKASSYEDICWAWLWSYVSWWVSNKSEFLWRHLLSLSLKLSKFTSFQQKPILMKTFIESDFEVMSVYQFQTKVNSSEDICWISVWSYVS